MKASASSPDDPPVTPKLTDAAWVRIKRAVGIRERATQLRGDIEHLLDHAPSLGTGWKFRASEIAPPLKRIADLARQLRDALPSKNTGRIKYGVYTQLEWQLICAAIEKRNLRPKDHVREWRDQLSGLVTATEKAAARARKLPSRGRPIGTGERPGLAPFVQILAVEMLSRGIRLTIHKGTEAGSLIEMLESLRPFLPRGFLPPRDKSPVSSYARALADGEKQWENMGNQKAPL